MSSSQDNGDGPTVILNSEERKMLREGPSDALTDMARWKRYQRIRDKLPWAIYDFGLLGGRYHENWEELNLGNVFTEEKLDLSKTREGVTGIFYVLYRGLFDDYMPAFEPYLQDGVTLAERHLNNRNVRVTFNVERFIGGNANVDHALARVNPDDVDSLTIPEMRAVLSTIAESDVDIAELVWEEYDGEPLFGRDRD